MFIHFEIVGSNFEGQSETAEDSYNVSTVFLKPQVDPPAEDILPEQLRPIGLTHPSYASTTSEGISHSYMSITKYP